MPDNLNVIALISGGKDSFFSILHCLRHNHRVVALANLYAGTDAVVQVIDPETAPREVRPAPEDSDLNSFMYQTVGHGVIPLYAAATGLPLYRRAITGGAAQSARDYDGVAAATRDVEEEAESMTELLRGVMERHPEANAVCAGAILSTYQRTRVESVAVRLGLVPLAYLWKYPSLPAPGSDDAQLLRDMYAAGLDARIIKVASAGLDEGMLWERISSEVGIARARKGLRFFGGGEGAVLGEGGEFETIVVDGPPVLFRGRVVVEEGAMKAVREGGGCSWLSFTEAKVEDKGGEGGSEAQVRVPDMLDSKFATILEALKEGPPELEVEPPVNHPHPRLGELGLSTPPDSGSPSTRGVDSHWGCFADPLTPGASIEEEARSVMDQVAAHVQPSSPSCITNTIVLLRHMSDFPVVNKVYGALFQFPNPPSRVTISCGDLLPEGRNIAVYITFRPDLAAEDRNGLHVQSRSYWAPANIGPYSQAIDVPIQSHRPSESASAQGLRWVAIAGQIPLIPSTMELPDPSEEASLALSIVLSLQHLWRIGTEKQVQLWSSAVAYFPRALDAEGMARRAGLAGSAWKQAHAEPSEEDEDDGLQSGPDLWDRTFNPDYMTLGDSPAGPAPLPDWEVFEGSEGPSQREPPLFAVEVEELPRGAAVEWHAHGGLSGVKPRAVRTGMCSGVSTIESRSVHWRSSLTAVACGQQTLLHNVVTIEKGVSDGPGVATEGAEVPGSVFEAVWKDTMVVAGIEGKVLDTMQSPRPYLVYGIAAEDHGGEEAFGAAPSGVPFIPCRSIWAPGGRRVIAVALFRNTL